MEKKLQIGWYEWCSLDKLGIPAIKAKIDTGAKTSALHAVDICPYVQKKIQKVSFLLYPLQANDDLKIRCHANVIDERFVISSNGHKEHRYVIKTTISLSNESWDIELTLSNRDPLRFRMLLGREALKNKVIINPGRTLCQGRLNKQTIKKMYQK